MSGKRRERFHVLRAHSLFLLLLATYVAAAVWLAFRVPAFSMPNEKLHYEYVALMRRTGRLPDPATSLRPDERHQPPFYYALTTALSLPFARPPLDSEFEKNPYPYATVEGNRNPFLHTTPATVPVLYLGRLLSILFGASAIASVYAAANLSLPRETSLLIASIVAFQPMFLYLSAAFGNDLAVTAMASFLLAYTTFLIVRNRGKGAYILWGVLFAAAVLTKASAVFLGLLLPVACLAKWQTTRRTATAAICAASGLLGFFPIYAAWLIFNQKRELDSLGISPSLPLDRLLALPPGDVRLLQPYLLRLWRSFWLDWSVGETGYTSNWIYVASAILLLLFLLGGLRWIRGSPGGRILAAMHWLWIVPLISLFIGVKALMVKETGFIVPEGRWILIAWPSLAWLAGSGWSLWWPVNRRAWASKYFSLVPPATTLILMLVLIPRLNPQAQKLKDVQSIPDNATPVGLTYDGQISLLAVRSGLFVGDRPAKVDLFWQAVTEVNRDYLVCSQLVVPMVDSWQIADRRCTFQGNGLAPSRGWQQGEIYQDEIVFRPQVELNGPTVAFILVDLLDDEKKVPAYSDSLPVETAVVEQVVLRPAETPSPGHDALLESPVEFGELLELVGLSFDQSGEGSMVTLWWQAKASMETDYTLFVHLLDETGELLAQSDSMPDSGRSPTRVWQPGDMIRDEHQLPGRSPANGTLLIGAYDPASLTRLPAVQEGQVLVDDAFRFSLP